MFFYRSFFFVMHYYYLSLYLFFFLSICPPVCFDLRISLYLNVVYLSLVSIYQFVCIHLSLGTYLFTCLSFFAYIFISLFINIPKYLTNLSLSIYLFADQFNNLSFEPVAFLFCFLWRGLGKVEPRPPVSALRSVYFSRRSSCVGRGFCPQSPFSDLHRNGL